ncbi:MAG: OmpA family protein [Flavobacteriaceae bacterium]|jgi:chemotaxis protein MotB|nr:OmpA family protein [Flavobacteriaceae bacterium]
MKLHVLSVAFIALTLGSCVSSKRFNTVNKDLESTKSELASTKRTMNDYASEIGKYEAQVKALSDQNNFLRSNNQDLINNMDNFTTLTSKGAENLEKTLESLKEKELTINKLQNAITRRDSVNLALVASLKGALGNLNDQDIEINVEKGVVFVSIADKLLFRSGSYSVSEEAKRILGKVATVVNAKPDFEFMVEGHTDNVPYKTNVEIKDNWDLSVKRATAIVRILQNEFKVDPKRMTAAGRSYYAPLVENNSAANRARNRRTRIVVLPKLDQFYSMIEDGMKDPSIQ